MKQNSGSREEGKTTRNFEKLEGELSDGRECIKLDKVKSGKNKGYNKCKT